MIGIGLRVLQASSDIDSAIEEKARSEKMVKKTTCQ
jgi:hypothetical protein